VVDGTPSMVTVYVMARDGEAFESEFVEVVVWNYFQRENTVDEGGRKEGGGGGGRKRGTQLG